LDSRCRLALNFLKLALQVSNSFLCPSLVNFQLGLTRTSCPDAAPEPRQVLPHPPQSGKLILELSEFYLQHRLLCPSPFGENVKYKFGAINNSGVKQLLKVSRLRWGKVVVEDDQVSAKFSAHSRQFFCLALTDEVSRVNLFSGLSQDPNDLCPCRVCEGCEFLQFLFKFIAIVQSNANQNCSFFLSNSLRFKSLQRSTSPRAHLLGAVIILRQRSSKGNMRSAALRLPAHRCCLGGICGV